MSVPKALKARGVSEILKQVNLRAREILKALDDDTKARKLHETRNEQG